MFNDDVRAVHRQVNFMKGSRLTSSTANNSAYPSAGRTTATTLGDWLLLLFSIASSTLIGGLWFFQQANLRHLDARIARLQQKIERLPKSVPAIDRVKLDKEQIVLERDRIGAQNGVSNVLFQGIGATILGGLTYTGWQFLRRSQAQFQSLQDRQITDRFSQALNHLASDKMEVRVGGIYMLEHLASESSSEYWLTIEILTAFVRERAAPQRFPANGGELPEHRQQSDLPIPTDIQAVMKVLSRRDISKDRLDRQIELRGSNLRAADLNGVKLPGADLWKVNLCEAQLWHAQLAGASLGRANLRDASLWQANLEGAYLWKVNLQGANLTEANLAQANLEESNLKDANLHQTNLISADLRKVVGLTHSQLSSAICDETTQLPDYIHLVSG